MEETLNDLIDRAGRKEVFAFVASLTIPGIPIPDEIYRAAAIAVLKEKEPANEER